MKTAALLACTFALGGCANLNVSWSFTASYNSMVQSQSMLMHMPAAAEPAESPKPAPAPVNPGSGS